MSRLALPSLVLVSAFSLGAVGKAIPSVSAPEREPAPSAEAETFPCAVGMLPDDGICIHLPSDDEGAPEAESSRNTHRDRRGQWTQYDQIARRPERPIDYDVYRYPVPPGLPGGHYVISGYDLDKPDDLQRRGRTLKHVGHGGLDIPQRKGTPVSLVNLEHQTGEAEVLFVGDLFGITVITRHTVKEGGLTHDYVVLFGHLDAPAVGLARGRMLVDGDTLGYVGDTGSPELVHLHLEVRRVRDGIDTAKLDASALIANEISVVCDPRNVLPLR